MMSIVIQEIFFESFFTRSPMYAFIATVQFTPPFSPSIGKLGFAKALVNTR